MTRKEQISAEATDKFMYTFSPIPPEAKELFETRHKAFCQGAEWADENPRYHGGAAIEKALMNEKILKAKVRVLTEALEFYADPKHWTIQWVEGGSGDYGDRARKALDETKDGE